MLHRKTFLVKENVSVVKLADTSDILDPASGSTLGTAAENCSVLWNVLRLVVNKRLLPTAIEVRSGTAPTPVRIFKRSAFFRRKLFSSADTHAIARSESAKPAPETRAHLLAAGVAIDTFNREKYREGAGARAGARMRWRAKAE